MLCLTSLIGMTTSADNEVVICVVDDKTVVVLFFSSTELLLVTMALFTLLYSVLTLLLVFGCEGDTIETDDVRLKFKVFCISWAVDYKFL